MKEVFLRKSGVKLEAVDEHGEETLRTYPDGVVLRVKLTQPRSSASHRFFFAFLNEVYLNWPETHPFRPDDMEHLRAWLTVKVGHMQLMEFDLPDGIMAREAVRVARAAIFEFSGGRPIWFKIINNKIFAAWPKSIEFHKMDEREFCGFTDAIFSLIYQETGLDVEEHYREWKDKHGSLQMAPARQKEEPDAKPAGLYIP